MTELFRIETDRLRLVWSGPERNLPGAARGTPHRLLEQTDYSLFLQSTGDDPVSIEHRDPILLRGLSSADGGRIVFGRVNFGSQVGRSTFVLFAGDAPEIELEVEVFPSKLDYERDYIRLLDDTREILAGLVLEYLRSTFRLGRAESTAHSSQTEWMLLLRHTIDELERALGQIARQPQRALSREPESARIERVRRPDAALRRAVLRGSGNGRSVPLGSGIMVRERLDERRARPTLDTPEHRWLAARLTRIRRRLARLHREEAGRPGGARRDRTLAELAALEERIVRLGRAEPLAAAGGEPPPGFASLQLLGAPGYREAYRSCQLLGMGLGVESGPVELSLRDLHLLYEQWCFLALVRAVAGIVGAPLPARELLTAEEHGLRVRLRRGAEQAVHLDAPGRRRITLAYNPRFGGDPLLVPQRPDLLLGLHDPDSPPIYFVLDAKYRLDTSPEYTTRYGSPGPPEEALNTLHRYRDALTQPDRPVAQAVALFPHRETEPGAFRASRLWRSIEQVGVGAIPVLPGATAYLEAWARGVLEHGRPGP